MKKLQLLAVLAISAIIITSCGNNHADTENKTDSSAVIIPPPDNNSATNPSLADTNFSKNHADTAGVKKDSLK